MRLMPTFNFNTMLLFAKFVTKLFCNSQPFKEILRIYGIMARQAPANLCVLVLASHNCFLRHSITGGMATREKRQCLSKNGRLEAENSWDTTSKFGRTDIRSSRKSRDPLCHLNARDELSSRQTIHCKNASVPIRHCSRHSDADSSKWTSTPSHFSTSNRPSSLQTDSPTTSAEDDDWDSWDEWYYENGGEI